MLAAPVTPMIDLAVLEQVDVRVIRTPKIRPRRNR